MKRSTQTGGGSIRERENNFEYVSLDGNAQQWRSASQALEVVWRGTGFLPYLSHIQQR
jgi:hypothetical protein